MLTFDMIVNAGRVLGLVVERHNSDVINVWVERHRDDNVVCCGCLDEAWSVIYHYGKYWELCECE